MKREASAPYPVRAQLLRTASGLNIGTITGRPTSETPGNVGIALSGGGTRSAIASMGQVRALAALGWLDETRAISSASGGSWLSIPFTFVGTSTDDATLLGTYVADPSTLVFDKGDAATDLRTLHGCTAVASLSHASASLAGLALRAAELDVDGCPHGQLWSQAVGELILEPHGLYDVDHDTWNATAFFAPDAATAQQIIDANPQLPTTSHVVHAAKGDATRPFLVVAGAMVLDSNDYVPVQFTPWYSGVFGGVPKSTIGGGGITSFAFGGRLQESIDDGITVSLVAPLALTDVMGISSNALASGLSGHGFDALDGQYDYFSPLAAAPAGSTYDFIDGGGLENTAIAPLLAYADIDAIVAFVNSESPVSVDARGVVVLDTAIPPLFGLQPYDEHRGYVPYAGDPKPRAPQYAGNQVFSNADGEFDALQAAIGAQLQQGAPLIALQSLTTVANEKFAVAGGKTIPVLWNHLGAASRWPVSDQVRKKIPHRFPNYSTLDTERTATEINYLAHFTGWVVSQSQSYLQQLYTGA